MIPSLLSILSSKRFPLNDEKATQAEIEQVLLKNFPAWMVDREYVLDNKNTIDFLINQKYGIEVKIKAGKRAIYKQCERYCQFETIHSLILVTNTSMGFPQQINGKSCYVINLGKAWL